MKPRPNRRIRHAICNWRQSYYRLAGHDVAELVEQMMGLSWGRITPPETTEPESMRAALLIFLETKGWIQRVAGYREVVVTLPGKAAIRQHFRR